MSVGANPPLTKIFVGRLPENADPIELRRLFERYGEVTECDILNRYGFVHMKSEEMALEAIRNLDNYNFMGSQISVEQSTGKKGGRGGRGGGPMRGGRGGGRFGGGFGGRGGPPSRGPPYTRELPREYERRGPPSGPPPSRNGYGAGGYEDYDRGANGYEAYGYGAGRQPQTMMAGRERQMGGWGAREAERAPADMMGRPPAPAYDRRPPANGYGDMSRTYAERPAVAPQASMAGAYDRRPMYEARPPADPYTRRTPPPAAGGYAMGGGYDRAPADPYRRYPPAAPHERDMPPRRY
ncbi:Hypothetical predicted protein [Cloeon dipterum]|uniref:RRM domain-containing protein n=1 Tax=Cloeon dipterum TaxID=197152 RepID=A0A8S1CGX0_9INSE|nr:Hypothetical predicted protein [Cloeon dipterum]